MSLEELMRQRDVVNLHIDSMVAVAFVNRQGGTRSCILCLETLDLWWMVLAKRGWVKAHGVPREINNKADFLSKYSLERWYFRLQPEVVEVLWRRWFRLSTDLFALADFYQAAGYFSCVSDPQAIRMDCGGLLALPQLRLSARTTHLQLPWQDLGARYHGDHGDAALENGGMVGHAARHGQGGAGQVEQHQGHLQEARGANP